MCKKYTYGNSDKTVAQNTRLLEIENEILSLKKERRDVIKRCEHHFIATEKTAHHLRRFPKRNNKTIYNLLRVNAGDNEATDVYTPFICIKCGEEYNPPTMCHCPLCASKVEGHWIQDNNGIDTHLIVSCTKCDFVGCAEEQEHFDKWLNKLTQPGDGLTSDDR